jgi:hypothetical protein
VHRPAQQVLRSPACCCIRQQTSNTCDSCCCCYHSSRRLLRHIDHPQLQLAPLSPLPSLATGKLPLLETAAHDSSCHAGTRLQACLPPGAGTCVQTAADVQSSCCRSTTSSSSNVAATAAGCCTHRCCCLHMLLITLLHNRQQHPTLRECLLAESLLVARVV